MPRGRPTGQLNPTRRRVLSYWRDHGPCSIGQVCRATGVERSRLKRIIRALEQMQDENGACYELPCIPAKPGRPANQNATENNWPRELWPRFSVG